ncbi:MAG: hypothetical protein QF416_06475 [Candidatus Marinimicrobia bacterium]|nr:hypothetical protein [Candidatus Neomarinimicrobiota bacterium]
MRKIIFQLFLFSSFLFGQQIIVMSPEPGSKQSGEDLLIAASLYGLESVTPEIVFLYLDEEDISGKAFIDPDMVSYIPSLLTPGEHHIKLVAGKVDSVVWSFEILGKKEAIAAERSTFSVGGNITSSTNLDKIEDVSLNVNQLAVNLHGNVYKDIKFKTKLKLTSDENPLYQSRNLYGLGLTFGKYGHLNIGDSNPRLSYFTLAGKRIRGLDLNLMLGPINLTFIKGEVNRAIQGGSEIDQVYSHSVESDTVGTKFMALQRQGHTFRQDLLAGRFGLGRGEKFRFGLSFLKVKDNVNSVDAVIDDALIEISAADTVFGLQEGDQFTYDELVNELGSQQLVVSDISDWSGVKPRDNIVIATDLGLFLDHKRIALEGEAAFSLLNNDISQGALTLAGLDTLLDSLQDNSIGGFMDLGAFPDPADYENIFVINQNMVPLSPISPELFADSGAISLGEALLSMPSLALRAKATFNYFGNLFGFEFSQVGPEFTSLANPYLVTDNREWKVTDKLRLLQNRMFLTLSYRHQNNGISSSSENIRNQNTFTAGINVMPGPGLPTANLTYKTVARDNGITEITELDSVTFSDNRENTLLKSIILSSNYNFNIRGLSNTVMGTFVQVDKEDKFSDRDWDLNFVDPSLSSQVISLALTTRFPFPLTTNMAVTNNASEYSIGPGEWNNLDFLTAAINGDYKLNQLGLVVLGGVNYAKGTGAADISWIGIKGGLRYRILENLNLNATGELRDKTANGEKSTSIIARANLAYTF